MTRMDLGAQSATGMWSSALGVVVVTLGWSLGHGLPGLLAAVVVAGSWYTLPARYTFTIGQFALIALASQESANAILVIGGGELGLFMILGTALSSSVPSRPRWIPASAVTGIALLAIAGWLTSRWLGSVWRAVALLGGVGALVTYALHRYERFRLELPAEIAVGDYE